LPPAVTPSLQLPAAIARRSAPRSTIAQCTNPARLLNRDQQIAASDRCRFGGRIGIDAQQRE